MSTAGGKRPRHHRVGDGSPALRLLARGSEICEAEGRRVHGLHGARGALGVGPKQSLFETLERLVSVVARALGHKYGYGAQGAVVYISSQIRRVCEFTVSQHDFTHPRFFACALMKLIARFGTVKSFPEITIANPRLCFASVSLPSDISSR